MEESYKYVHQPEVYVNKTNSHQPKDVSQMYDELSKKSSIVCLVYTLLNTPSFHNLKFHSLINILFN